MNFMQPCLAYNLTSQVPCFLHVCESDSSRCEKKESPFSWLSMLLSPVSLQLEELIENVARNQITTLLKSMFDVKELREDWERLVLKARGLFVCFLFFFQVIGSQLILRSEEIQDIVSFLLAV